MTNRPKLIKMIAISGYILFAFLSIHTINNIYFYLFSFFLAMICLLKKYLKLSFTFAILTYLIMPIWLSFNGIFYENTHHYSILTDFITVFTISLLFVIMNKSNDIKDKFLYLILSIIAIIFYQYSAYSDIIYWSSILIIIINVLTLTDIEFKQNDDKKLFTGILFIILTMISYHVFTNFETKNSNEIGVLKSEWCDVSVIPDKNHYIMDYFYAYSDFLKLLKTYGNVNTINNSDLDKNLNYNTIILITPTQSITKNQVQNLRNFVKQGGRLILITDHTNLYGHLDAVNGLLASFKVRMNDDAVFNPKNYFEKAILNINNLKLKSLYMKTGNSIVPPINAKIWAITRKNISEKADYTNQNFFGDLSFTEDDNVGSFPIGITIKYGKGDFVIWNDSTIFSNFAISQKDNIKLLDYIIKNRIYDNLKRNIPFENIDIISTGKGTFLEAPPGHLPTKNQYSTLIANFTRENLWPNFTNKQHDKSVLFTTYKYFSKHQDNIKSQKIVIIDDIPQNNILNIKRIYFEDNNSDDFYYAQNKTSIVCKYKNKQIIVGKNLFSDNELGTWWNTIDISPYKKYMITEILNWIQDRQQDVLPYKYPKLKLVKSGLKVHLDNGEDKYLKNISRSDTINMNNEKILYLGHRKWVYIIDSKTILGSPEMSDNLSNGYSKKWLGTFCNK